VAKLQLPLARLQSKAISTPYRGSTVKTVQQPGANERQWEAHLHLG